jgi:hypothetical protein
MTTLQYEYEHDFQNWLNRNINLLKTGQLHELDVTHLIEELEDMGKSNVRELESRLMILIAHLLKWQFQPEKQSSSWRGSINEQRLQLLRLLSKVPSLKRQLQNAVEDVYGDSVFLASDETNLPKSHFPQACPYSMEQLLDKAFYPEPE